MYPHLINDGVMSIQTKNCIACGNPADMHNVIGSFCWTHKDNFVREFKTIDDLRFLDVITNSTLRNHIKEYIKTVWKL